MRFLVYADVQATEGHERLFSNPGIPLQRKRVEDFYRTISEIAAAEQVDGILDLGDTTDDRSSIPVPTLDSLLGLLDGLPKGQNYKLIGNHEQFVKSTAIHCGRLYERHFEVIPDRVIRQFQARGRSRPFTILFCSYPADENELDGWLQRQEIAGKCLFLGHFQVHGCALNSGQSLSGVRATSIRADLALLGHVHKPQAVTDRIHYVGSPFQQDFGEAGEVKRVGVVDTDSMTVSWITLDGFPEYRVLHANEFFDRDWSVSEDRLKVILRTPEETAAFYAHPLSHRYEPVYNYAVAAESVSAAPAALTNNRDELMRAYLKKRTPKSANIVLSNAEMLEFGQMLSNGATCS